MSERPTPETDALEIAMDQDDAPPVAKLIPYAQLCRRLERERDEALTQERIHYDNCESMRIQRDELREKLTQAIGSRSQYLVRMIRAEMERDEAREQLNKEFWGGSVTISRNGYVQDLEAKLSELEERYQVLYEKTGSDIYEARKQRDSAIMHVDTLAGAIARFSKGECGLVNLIEFAEDALAAYRTRKQPNQKEQ
jgi:hypothetical protein